MAKLLKLRGGTTSQHSTFTGADREVTVDTDKETLVVHDGSQAGGYPLARADGTGTTNFTISGEMQSGTLDVNGNADISGNLVIGGTVDGRDIATDGTKLDTIESNATADQTAAEIRALVESATDSNVFTDADHTKLNGIASGATNVTNNNQLTNGAGYVTSSGVTSVATGGGLTGGTITGTGTISHADTSSQSSVNNSGATFIQDITLDTYGHITGLTSATASGGKVAQIQETRKTNTFSTTAGNAGTTMMSRTITPSSTSSKILVTVSIGCISSDAATIDTSICYIKRNSTDTILGDSSGSRRRSAFVLMTPNSSRGSGGHSFQVLDSPATTSQVTYNFLVSGDEGVAILFNRTDNDQNADRTYSARTGCTMQCIEITA